MYLKKFGTQNTNKMESKKLKALQNFSEIKKERTETFGALMQISSTIRFLEKSRRDLYKKIHKLDDKLVKAKKKTI